MTIYLIYYIKQTYFNMNENADEQKKDIDDVENSEELKKEMLKPIVKSKSETDKELQDLEVETTGWWNWRWRWLNTIFLHYH